MRDMVVFVSDASYKLDSTAILAVQDEHTGRTYQKIVVEKLKSSLEAEEQALRFAIDIAIVNEYKHVIFIYDCLALNTDVLKKRYARNFESIQFLWLKRSFISVVDRITKKEESEEIRELRMMTDEAKDKKIFEEFSPYVRTMEEVSIFNKNRPGKYKIETENNRYALLNFVYFLLSKIGKKKIKRDIEKYFNRIERQKIYRIKRNQEYRGMMKQLNIENSFIESMITHKINRKTRKKHKRA